MISRRKFFIIWVLGLMSGFTLMLTGNTLNFWLSKDNIDITTIGIFSLVSMPYAINFIWAPIFDTVDIPYLTKLYGRRLAWIIITQISLSLSVFFISLCSPLRNLWLFAIMCVFIAFLSSAQDTLLGALRTEIVEKNMQIRISGMYIFGYRIGMLISSSGAIYVSSNIAWNLIYELFSIIILTFPVVLILFKDNLKILHAENNGTSDHLKIKKLGLFRTIIGLISVILKPVGTKNYVLLIIAFLILYRLPDNLINTMINSFLLHIGYNEFEISTVGKLFGVSSAIIGGLLASYILKRQNLFTSLLIFGILHALAHTLFILQEINGKNIYLLFFVNGLESVTGGMTMAAYIAYLASLCQGKFRATQYSFFSSMMGVSRATLPAISGYLVSMLGWSGFYIFTLFISVPSLILIIYLKKYNANWDGGWRKDD